MHRPSGTCWPGWRRERTSGQGALLLFACPAHCVRQAADEQSVMARESTSVRSMRDLKRVPPFTQSVDAKVPAENVVVSHFVAEAGKWFAASEASDGSVHVGFGNTEPLARRIAGLRTFEHLKARAEGKHPDLSPDQMLAARDELAAELEVLEGAIRAHNGDFPEHASREIVLIQVQTARALVKAGAGKGILARWVAPVLLFIAGGFANGVLGAYAERALTALHRVLLLTLAS